MTSKDARSSLHAETAVAPVGLDHAALTPYFGDPLPASEAAMWAAMPVDRRAKAMQRMKALTRWDGGAGPMTTAQAAADAGVSVNRWFEMAKAWRERRSLAALGTFAGSSRRPDPRQSALQSIVPEVLGPWPTGSVRQMAIKLGEASAAQGGGKVGDSMLRRVVEEELRRRDAERRLGNDIQFDCSACSVLRPDGSPYTLFAVLDRGSQLLLGAAMGDVGDSRTGHAAACRDARRRIDAKAYDGLPWVDRPSRMELVVGLDADRWTGLRDEMAAAGLSAPVEPSTKPSRFGRYLRNAVGDRLGRIDLWYGRTVPEPSRGAKVAERSLRLEAQDAEALLGAQVDHHNGDRRTSLPPSPGTVPPAELRLALDHLAGG